MNKSKQKSRAVHAAKKDPKKPAAFEPLPASAQAAPTNNGQNGEFDPKPIVEKLQLWRLNSPTPTYFAPMQSGDDWREMGNGDLIRLLKLNGIEVRPPKNESWRITQADLMSEYIQNYRQVDFAGPLAGYKAGQHFLRDGRPFIVRGGPKLIEPKAGDWSLIEKILKPRFEDPAGPQLDYFLLWLKRAVEPLYQGRIRKGPMLILVGPNDSGKSFIQERIITPVLGGRQFDPTEYFKNEQGFNKHLMASESLVIGEFAFPLDGASRLMLSEKFKKIIANDSQTYHPKGRDAMTMYPHFRLSISINDNEEKIRALPPMNNDLIDKVVLLKVHGGFAMPMPTNTDVEEKAFAEVEHAQLPAFVHYLLNTWEPPEEIASGRFGMAVWQHPLIVDSLWEQEPASRFAFLLDLELFPKANVDNWKPWGWVSAVELHEEVTAKDAPHSLQFRSVAKHEGAFAQMLGMLFKREGEALGRARGIKSHDIAKMISEEDQERRYARRHTRTGNFWLIRPPAKQ